VLRNVQVLHTFCISSSGHGPTVDHIQMIEISCADVQDPPCETPAHLSHFITVHLCAPPKFCCCLYHSTRLLSWDELSTALLLQSGTLLNIVTAADSLATKTFKSTLKTCLFNQTLSVHAAKLVCHAPSISTIFHYKSRF